MKMLIRRWLPAPLMGLMLMTAFCHGEYTYLGNLLSYQSTPSGITLTCENAVKVHITFYKPNVIRVILKRPAYLNDLLTLPIVERQAETVAVNFREEDTHLRLNSKDMGLIIHKMPCRISIVDARGHVINRDDPGLGIGWDGNEVRCWKSLGPGERFFGLGKINGDVNKAGREWVMWNRSTPDYAGEGDPGQRSIPFYIGLYKNQAYGIYFNNSYRTVFNFGAGNERYTSFAADGGALDYFFIYGPQISQVTTAFSEITGRPFLPPLWSLGYQQGRRSYYPAEDVLELARTFRAKKIPADVIFLDFHYMDNNRQFTWHPQRFPNPAEMLQILKGMGFKVVAAIHPGISSDENYSIAKDGISGGHFLKYPDGELYVGEGPAGRSFFPDFSREETQAWWGGHLAGLLNDGIAGFTNDLSEKAFPGAGFPMELLMDDGAKLSSFKKMHNLYAFLMSRATFEAIRKQLPGRRPLVINGNGFAGDQRFVVALSGDNSATWQDLETGIRSAITLGLSGMPLNAVVTGGFRGAPSAELFARWVQAGSMMPLFQVNSAENTPDQEPWSFGEEIENICRRYIELRYRMLPYFYSLMWEATESGTPPIRPLFWHFQEDERVYEREFQQQFLVGEHLMIAPVTREGQRLKKVYLPAGDWMDLNTKIEYEGGQTIVVDTPTAILPMFLHSGAVIPRQPLRQYVGDSAPAALTVDVFVKKAYGHFLLYEDDGESMAYNSGAYSLTRLEMNYLREIYSFSRTRLAGAYPLPQRRMKVNFYGIPAAPENVTLNGARLLPLAVEDNSEGFFFDTAERRLTVTFMTTTGTQTVQFR